LRLPGEIKKQPPSLSLSSDWVKKAFKTMRRFYFFFLLFFAGALSFQGMVVAAEESSASSGGAVVGPSVEPEEFSEEFEADSDAASGFYQQTMISGDVAEYSPETSSPAKKRKKDTTLPGGRFKMSGKYRLAMGVENEFIFNQANADLQERNFRYLFGEDLNNTYDPGIYSQYLVNIDFAPTDKINFYTQLVADPWSYVGTTGEQEIRNLGTGASIIRPNLKYFGAFNGVLNEIYRANTGDSVSTPLMEYQKGHVSPFTVPGFTDFSTRYRFSELDVDFEFHPIRKLWMDYTEDQWHVRVFAFADQAQALTSDDPLELSNHKDYWQQSPWLYQYVPIQFFTDRSINRGHYSDTLSFLARDTEGNRLVLLRGASFEGDFGNTYLAATVAAPYTPWDEHLHDSLISDNLPGAVRLKHQVTDQVMVGSIYTFRNGFIDDSIADSNQVLGIDTKIEVNKNITVKAEVAGSQHSLDELTDERLRTDTEGYAYKAVVDLNYDENPERKTEFQFSFTQMDEKFNPNLSRYTNTRDDHFWGNHLTFYEFPPGMEHFRLGDGIDVNRYVFRIKWKEKLFKERFVNLFDVRNVHKASNDAYKETVLRDEVTFKINDQWTAKGLFRWHGLPTTTDDIEPFVSNFYFTNAFDPVLKNFDVVGGKDADRFTYAGGLQYIINKQWTAEGFYERSNNISDFPRALLNDTFRDSNDLVDGLLLDHVTNFLYGQGPLGGLPPYEYHTIVRERIIFRPQERLELTFHAAQNSYKYAAGIDDNINHQGISIDFAATKKLQFFMDYTHSIQIDIPKLIATSYTDHDFRSHHNVYASVDYRLHPSQVLKAEYGVFGLGVDAPQVSPYSTTSFSLPTIDTEHIFRLSLTGDF
jgi:hypothetical protein